MKKASKPGSAKTSSAQEKPPAKLAKPKNPQGGAALAETVSAIEYTRMDVSQSSPPFQVRCAAQRQGSK
jgi:hypothetical protein